MKINVGYLAEKLARNNVNVYIFGSQETCSQALCQECVPPNKYSYFSTKTYAVGTQKTRFNETILSSTRTYVITDGEENIYNFTV